MVCFLFFAFGLFYPSKFQLFGSCRNELFPITGFSNFSVLSSVQMIHNLFIHSIVNFWLTFRKWNFRCFSVYIVHLISLCILSYHFFLIRFIHSYIRLNGVRYTIRGRYSFSILETTRGCPTFSGLFYW